MDLLIDSAAGSAMFSFVDGFSEYNQIIMAPKDTEKTAFKTPIELEDYVDDIMVKSKRRVEHFHVFRKLFEEM